MSSNAFVLTKHIASSNTPPSFRRFIDLVEACGFKVKHSSLQPTSITLRETQVCLIDVDYCKADLLFSIPLLREYQHVKKVFFNVDASDVEFQFKALQMGLHGVLVKDSSMDLIVKGLGQIKQGNRWFSRDVMTRFIDECLQQHATRDSQREIQSDILTKREVAITKLIANGAQNQEVADQLHISVNTVKTHVYSIFRKTDCRNRVELIKWFATNSQVTL